MGGPRLRYLILDLDDTLYPRRSGVMDLVNQRIGRYMVERLGFPPEQAEALRQRYYAQYGTTLRGLMEEYHIDPEDYLAYVHDVPLEDYLQPDPALDAMLARIPLTKVIFTNASEEHARRVLERLGVARHFPIILDVRRLDYCNKPDPEAYSADPAAPAGPGPRVRLRGRLPPQPPAGAGAGDDHHPGGWGRDGWGGLPRPQHPGD
jgi:putative hydrolase of the HAD superfamily